MNAIRLRRSLTIGAVTVGLIAGIASGSAIVGAGFIGAILALHVLPVDADGPDWGLFEETAYYGLWVAVAVLIGTSLV